jgi:hypothetical protein
MSSNKIIVVKESANSLTVGLPITQETLESVTDRGNTTNNSITVSGLTVNGAINVSGISASGITANSASILVIQNGTLFNGNQMVANQATIGQVNSILATTSGIVATNVTATTINASGITTSGLTANSVIVANALTSTVITATNDLNTSALNAVDIFSSTLEVEDITASSVTSTSVSANTASVASGINVSGTSIFSGPIGIGIAVPTKPLHVTGSALIEGNIDTNGNIIIHKGNPRIRLRDISGGGHTQGFDIHVDTARFYIDDNTHNLNILDFNFDAPSSGHTLTLASNKFVIANAPNGNYNPSASVTVDGSGNVAVGLSGTTHRFHVSGSSAFSGPVVATTVSATSVSSTTANITTVSSTTVNSTNVVATGITASAVSATTISASGITASGITASVSVTTSGLTASGVTANSIGSTSASINSLVVNTVIPSGTSVLVSGGLIVGPASGAIFNASGHLGINVSPSAPLHVSGSVRLDGQTTATPPANTSVVNAWLSININGTAYKIPLYV